MTVVMESILKIVTLIKTNKESLENHFVENVRIGENIGRFARV